VVGEIWICRPQGFGGLPWRGLRGTWKLCVLCIIVCICTTRYWYTYILRQRVSRLSYKSQRRPLLRGGATPELKNFPNMLYIVGHVVLPAQLLYQAIHGSGCLRTKYVSTRCSNLFICKTWRDCCQIELYRTSCLYKYAKWNKSFRVGRVLSNYIVVKSFAPNLCIQIQVVYKLLSKTTKKWRATVFGIQELLTHKHSWKSKNVEAQPKGSSIVVRGRIFENH
jgi:hypothetical protein